MADLEKLKKIIREEVRTVFREELSEILKEAIISKKETPIREAATPKRVVPPSTLNTAIPRPVAPILGAGNPLNALLAETAQTMTFEDFGNINGGYERPVEVVDSVDSMFASARKSSNLESIEINSVPDFTELMNKMNI